MISIQGQKHNIIKIANNMSKRAYPWSTNFRIEHNLKTRELEGN